METNWLILMTNLVETINQHSSDEMSYGTEKRELPIEYGYSSHFATNYNRFYQDKEYNVSHIHVDIEYYNFLIN